MATIKKDRTKLILEFREEGNDVAFFEGYGNVPLSPGRIERATQRAMFGLNKLIAEATREQRVKEREALEQLEKEKQDAKEPVVE